MTSSCRVSRHDGRSGRGCVAVNRLRRSHKWCLGDTSSNRWWDNHSWAGKKSGRDQTTHLARRHHCLIPPQWFFCLFSDPKSMKLWTFSLFFFWFWVPLPFVSIWTLSVVTSSVSVWSGPVFFVHTVWVAWPPGVCMCVCPYVCMCECLCVWSSSSADHNLSPCVVRGGRGETGLRNINSCWPPDPFEDNAASLPVNPERSGLVTCL